MASIARYEIGNFSGGEISWVGIHVPLSSSHHHLSASFLSDAVQSNSSASPTFRVSVQSGLVVVVVKTTAMTAVMATAVIGNLLVIASVLGDRRLRNRANSFVVSMALADLLVALLVMPFSAVQEISGRWNFGPAACDLFNANDVLFSTASLLHLCSISVDRYIAVSDPFHYGSRMTRRRAAALLACIWLASALLSHVPIHMGWYTTWEHRRRMMGTETAEQEPMRHCVFEVNRVYGIVSSLVSFWAPATVMVFAYRKIFREASRQDRSIRLGAHQEHRTTGCATAAVLAESSTSFGRQETGRDGTANQHLGLPPRHGKTSTSQRRDHKAARTLGIIMGAFLSCWFPFFTWYLTETMCGERCPTPPVVIFLLFWIGYLNSALNPVIYPFFNRDFRDAFRRLFRRLGFRRARIGRGWCSGRTSPLRRSPTGSDFFQLVVTNNKVIRDVITIDRQRELSSSTASYQNQDAQELQINNYRHVPSTT